MKILVAGAAGQVGCRLVRQLLDHNHEVRGTVLPDDPCLDRLDGLDIELAKGDLTDEAFVNSALDGIDRVVHTANFVGPQFDNNLQINRLIARVCGERADQLERLVYVSSSGVFPNNGEKFACAYHPVDEEHPRHPDGEYSLSKQIGEEFVNMAADYTGLRTVIVRPSHVQSGTAILSQFTAERAVQILKIGQASPRGELYMADGTELWHDVEAQAAYPDQPCSVRDDEGRSWLYQPNDARDIAHMLVCAVEEDAAVGESFNCGAPTPFYHTHAAPLLAELTGQTALEVQVPVWYRYDHAIGKAKRLINYRPRGTVEAMFESALRVRDEGWIDYTWE
ncbi:MAG: NAD(P)-dependent oxidoreductase [Caldilineaceae bacterium SB0661_bin_34]|nr:NAD(P)-dependent oxidoreductase [Caldilineaceae bacterium SB0661_bin_34]